MLWKLGCLIDCIRWARYVSAVVGFFCICLVIAYCTQPVSDMSEIPQVSHSIFNTRDRGSEGRVETLLLGR